MRILPAALWPRFLKRRLPTSLWGRSLLIIVLPVLIMQMAVTWVFFDAHWQTVTARLSEGLAGDIAWAAESYSEEPTPENPGGNRRPGPSGRCPCRWHCRKGRPVPREPGTRRDRRGRPRA